ncbi:MAG: O-antigen ligase family protein [Melioribacteraceae bacterium]|nr:O-antigen ligase family protein [Melioribacteraceae bacterium]MCF8354534.1 O-antigen ligase family protein [Melioribacteraceae bacterium]MCF8393830.1 O-antigen ligase family protein [Melioribacteraceae bacterium]MCF8418203.1 O-antigen ligase family protein [Melioribacteraceae bacterium]
MIFATGLDIWGQIFAGITIFHVGWFFSIFTTVILYLIRDIDEIKYLYSITYPFLFFIIIASISLIYTPNFENGLYIVVQTLALYLFFVLVANFIKSRNHLILIILILLFINISQTFLLVYQLLFENVTYFADSTVQTSEGFRIYRPSGTFHDPNVLCTYMIFGIIYSLSYLLFNKVKIKWKILLGIGILLSFIGTVLTFSRSGWLSLLFGIITVIFFYPKKRIIFYILTIGAIILSFALFFTPYGDLIIERFASIIDLMTDPSIRVRLALINSSFHMFVDNPFFGVGFKGFPVLYDLYLDPIVPQMLLYVKEPHTLWPALLAELGVLGVVSVFILFYVFFKESYKKAIEYYDDFSKSFYVSIFALFIAMNVDFFFYGFLFPQFNLLWLNFALFYSMKDNYQESN